MMARPISLRSQASKPRHRGGGYRGADEPELVHGTYPHTHDSDLEIHEQKRSNRGIELWSAAMVQHSKREDLAELLQKLAEILLLREILINGGEPDVSDLIEFG